MSVLPNSPHPHEPFDAEEATAARAYRALPGGEPSADLDARILAQARAAVSPARRRRRPWFLGAGLGAAAAAVMAAGLALQMGWLGGVPGGVPATQKEQRAPAGGKAKDEVESISVELMGTRDARKPEATTAPIAPAVPAAPPAPAAATPPRRAAAPPPPPPAPVTEEAPVMAEPAPQPFPAEETDKDDGRLDAPAPAATDSAAGAAAGERERAASAAQEGLDLSRDARLSKRAQSAYGPWTDDETLEPDAWLERIRERVNRGDRQSAEFSLRRFVLVHPRRAVPRELQRLLVE